MPRYRVVQPSFIGNALVKEGDIVEYEGEVSDNLELIVSSSGKGRRGGPKGSPTEDDESVDSLV